MAENHDTEVCIVGAGPAGAVCSLYLTRFKIPHILIDKSNFPRDKVCGESFDGRVSRILSDLDCLQGLYDQHIVKENRHWAFSMWETNMSFTIQDEHLPRLNAPRHLFDHYIFQKAIASPYVKTILGESVDEMKDHPNGITISSKKHTINARLGVLAHGAQSNLMRYTSGEKGKMVFSRCYHKGIENRDGLDFETFYFTKPLHGCLILCAQNDGICNVEIGVLAEEFKKGSHKMEGLLDQILRELPVLKQRFANAQALEKPKGTFMPAYNNVQDCVKPNLLIAGANAFSVNPITGLGVGNAMTMGKLAALQIKACYEEEDFSLAQLSNYQNEARKSLASVVSMNRSMNFVQTKLTLLAPLLKLMLGNKYMHRLLENPYYVRDRYNPKMYWNALFDKPVKQEPLSNG
jgi:flavin-dependent dehydrogenase